MSTFPDQFRLDGRTALVTGSGRGLGGGMARALAQAGARVRRHGRAAGRLGGRVGERDRRPFDQIEPEDFARLIDVDLAAAHALVKLVVPGMIERGWGRLILVTSIAGELAVPGASSYIAAKGGLAALARALPLAHRRGHHLGVG